jgi:carbamoyl-phosphate synthase large subunit
MRSTGEVMGVDANPGAALAKALVATGAALPDGGTVFVSVANRDKRAIVLPARRLSDLGFRLVATRGTAGVLERAGISVERVAKVSEGRSSPRNVAELIRGGKVDLVINTPFGRGPRTDGYFIRTAAAAAGVPCVTTLPGVFAAVRGIEALRGDATEPRSIQEYHAASWVEADPVQVRLTFEEAATGVATGGAG